MGLEEDVFTDGGNAVGYRKYTEYQLKTDPDEDDKATEIKLCNFSRPHMRAFHCSWWLYFTAFFIWFAIAPLLGEIRITLGLSRQDIWVSSLVGVAGTVLARYVVGWLCDKYGARIIFALILCSASIPTACTGLVNSAVGLAVLRFFIGFAGGTFVACQYWTSRMFAKSVVGTANGLASGWGSLGLGVTQLVMGSFLFPLFKVLFDSDAEKAWRLVSIVPAVVAFGTGIAVYYISDDTPWGNYADLQEHQAMAEVSSSAPSFRSGTPEVSSSTPSAPSAPSAPSFPNNALEVLSSAPSFLSGAINKKPIGVLSFQYGCCYGAELMMNNAAALYFRERFGQSTESAAAIAFLFGWMNLFTRGLGGFASDWANKRIGMRGRLWVQATCLLAEGGLVLLFANSNSLGGAIVIMVFFSLFAQAAEASTYGIVPYVDPTRTGTVAGIVGAGGNIGAVSFGIGFRHLEYKEAFVGMGVTIMISSVTTVFVIIKGHSGLLWGKDEEISQENTLVVPDAQQEYNEQEAQEIEA